MGRLSRPKKCLHLYSKKVRPMSKRTKTDIAAEKLMRDVTCVLAKDESFGENVQASVKAFYRKIARWHLRELESAMRSYDEEVW